MQALDELELELGYVPAGLHKFYEMFEAVLGTFGREE